MKRIYVGLCLLLGMSTEAGWAQKARDESFVEQSGFIL